MLKFAHIGGLVKLAAFSISIPTSILMEGDSLENIAFGRKIISTGSNALTTSHVGACHFRCFDGLQALWLEAAIFPAQASAHPAGRY